MSIVLQFVATSTLTADVIRWYSHGSYSHVDAVMPDGSLLGSQGSVFAGIPAGVQVRPANYTAFSKRTVVIVPAPYSVEQAFYAFLKAQVGKPYDTTAIAGFAVGRDWREDDSWMCSELQSAALERAGYFSHTLCAPTNKITPDDLALVLSALVTVSP
jgi:uncharacterized protein YycO